MMMTWTPDIVIYHDHCADGFGAAWACHERWPNAYYVPATYGQEPPNVSAANALIVDFSYKRAALEEMGRSAESIIVLDHHKTALEELQPWFTIVDRDNSPMTIDHVDANLPTDGRIIAHFDMNRSGARMAWDFCNPGVQAPLLIRLIEDRDLWRFTMEDTKPFSLWLRSEPFSFDRFTLLAQDLDEARAGHEIMTEARAMQRFFDAKVDEIASFAKRRRIGEHEPVVVNCPPMFASEVGHALLDKHPDAPFAATYFDAPNARMWSLRSRDDRVDVSVVASKFGGGGHRNAAGFGTPA
jgi:oligoribonuclease NrnB/cAMP/cGMP phosphodiesterase (DHH superfamily)